MLSSTVTAATLNAAVGMFGNSFTVTPDPFNPLTDTERTATVTEGGMGIGSYYGNDIEMSDLCGYELLVGFTGKFGSYGPVMHDSEYIGGRLADLIIRDGGEFSIAGADWNCDDESSDGAHENQSCENCDGHGYTAEGWVIGVDGGALSPLTVITTEADHTFHTYYSDYPLNETQPLAFLDPDGELIDIVGSGDWETAQTLAHDAAFIVVRAGFENEKAVRAAISEFEILADSRGVEVLNVGM